MRIEHCWITSCTINIIESAIHEFRGKIIKKEKHSNTKIGKTEIEIKMRKNTTLIIIRACAAYAEHKCSNNSSVTDEIAIPAKKQEIRNIQKI
jgi:hypothetical protein